MREAEKAIIESKLKSQANLVQFLQKTIEDFKHNVPDVTSYPQVVIPTKHESSRKVKSRFI